MSSDNNKVVFVDAGGIPIYAGREGDYTGPGTMLNEWGSYKASGHNPAKGVYRKWDFVSGVWVADTGSQQAWDDKKSGGAQRHAFRRAEMDKLLPNVGTSRNITTINEDLDVIVGILDSLTTPVANKPGY